MERRQNYDILDEVTKKNNPESSREGTDNDQIVKEDIPMVTEFVWAQVNLEDEVFHCLYELHEFAESIKLNLKQTKNTNFSYCAFEICPIILR